MTDPTREPARDPVPDVEKIYPPASAGLDPVTLPPDLDAAGLEAATFQQAISPRSLKPEDGVAARDQFYYARPATGAFRQNHFGRFTWAMIVVAGVVLGGAMAMMAAGA